MADRRRALRPGRPARTGRLPSAAQQAVTGASSPRPTFTFDGSMPRLRRILGVLLVTVVSRTPGDGGAGVPLPLVAVVVRYPQVSMTVVTSLAPARYSHVLHIGPTAETGRACRHGACPGCGARCRHGPDGGSTTPPRPTLRTSEAPPGRAACIGKPLDEGRDPTQSGSRPAPSRGRGCSAPRAAPRRSGPAPSGRRTGCPSRARPAPTRPRARSRPAERRRRGRRAQYQAVWSMPTSVTPTAASSSRSWSGTAE